MGYFNLFVLCYYSITPPPLLYLISTTIRRSCRFSFSLKRFPSQTLRKGFILRSLTTTNTTTEHLQISGATMVQSSLSSNSPRQMSIVLSPTSVVELSPFLNRKRALVRRCRFEGEKSISPNKEKSSRRKQAPKLSRWDSEPRLTAEEKTREGEKASQCGCSSRGRVPSSPLARSPKLPRRHGSKEKRNGGPSPFSKSRAPSLTVDEGFGKNLESLKKKVQGKFQP